MEYIITGPNHPIEISYQIAEQTTTVTATPPWSMSFRTDGEHAPLFLKAESQEISPLRLEIRVDDERLWATPRREQKSSVLKGTIDKFRHPPKS